jgi:steroid delta-isomerase-like uncharacterized protein
MGPKQNVACQWFEHVWNRGDASAIHRLATPDMIAHGPDGTGRTTADFVAFHKALTSAIPDLRLEITHCAEGRDMVAVQWVARGTHSGAAEGMPKPSGRPIEVSGLTLVRVVDGKCAEGWDDYDAVGLIKQLGAAV